MDDWVAIGVAVTALIFTVASFWWLNARRGRLVTYAPHSFAAHVGKDRSRLRLPLVLFNTGAQPIVVQNLRLRFPEEKAPEAVMEWQNTRTRLQPGQGDEDDLRAVFAAPGRSAEQRFVEFAGPFPGVVPRGRDYLVLIEAKLGHNSDWTPLLEFTLHTVHINSPTTFITYSNSPVPCSPRELERTKKTAEELVQKYGAPAE